MIDYGKARLAVIGMGWIGEYMVPCYERLLGNGHASRILAVKATDRRLEELRKQYGFEAMAGDCLERLKALRPSFLVLSVRPYEMEGVVEALYRLFEGPGRRHAPDIFICPEPASKMVYPDPGGRCEDRMRASGHGDFHWRC